MLKLIKHIRSEQAATDKQSNVGQDSWTKVSTEQARAESAQPAWHDMSRRLIQRLNTADDAAPELQMPGYDIPPPFQQRNKS